MSRMNVETRWSALIAAKRSLNSSKIPAEWRLQAHVLDIIDENATLGVLDIPKICGILSDSELELTEKHDATDLLQMMRDGTARSEDIVRAFCKRAAIAQQLVSGHRHRKTQTQGTYIARQTA